MLFSLLPLTVIPFLICRQIIKQKLAPSFSSFSSSIQLNIPYEKLCVCAVLSQLVYKNESQILSDSLKNINNDKSLYTYVKHCIQNDIQFFQNHKTDAQAYAWVSNNTAYVVFRGTKGMQDVLVDMEICQKPFGKQNNVKVHNGFRLQFESVESDITHMLETNADLFNTIVFTGHSLGASLATLASIYYTIHFTGKYHIKLYNFGSPRVGNSQFVEYFSKLKPNIDCWRVFNYEDPVPMVPITNDYKHICNNSIELGEHYCRIIKCDCFWIYRPIRSCICINLIKPIQAHNLNLYIRRLKQLKTQQMHHTISKHVSKY